MANIRKDPFHSGFIGIWTPAAFLKLGLKPIEAFLMSFIQSYEAVKADPTRNIKAKRKRPCYASDAYLADLFNVSSSTIARALAKLVKLGYVKIENPNPRRHLLSIHKYNIDMALYRGRKIAKQTYVIMTQKRKKKRA